MLAALLTAPKLLVFSIDALEFHLHYSVCKLLKYLFSDINSHNNNPPHIEK